MVIVLLLLMMVIVLLLLLLMMVIVLLLLLLMMMIVVMMMVMMTYLKTNSHNGSNTCNLIRFSQFENSLILILTKLGLITNVHSNSITTNKIK